MARKQPGIGGGLAFGSNTGGTPFNPGLRRKPAPKPYISPPTLSFDPAIEAQRRAAARGLEDTESDIKTERHFAGKDLRESLADIKRKTMRGRQDIGRDANRGQQKLSYQEQDVNKQAGRAFQDFDTQLASIGRQFAQLGHRQGEAANSAGVLDAGTQAASAAARGANQQLAEAPIATARQRTGEDLATALSRIGTGRGEIEADRTRGLTRLTQDRNDLRQEKKQNASRAFFTLKRDLQRARREGSIADVNLLTKEIYSARAEHPAVFRSWAKENPGVVPELEGKPVPGGKPKPKQNKPQTGGTSAPPKRRRR